ncbi:MAG: HD domain-containing protein [Erysipelotrichaceae bacterium]|nr:HD domain-containing protein [Erysipelotrichaceae bacterium]
MKKLDEVKVLRDPIHGYIHIKYQIIWDCLNAPEFQRLRRIHQLGATHIVYHTAEHSRFSHSLGVYEIVRRMISENGDIGQALSQYEKITVMLAALLHDIGHGPFSHSFEHVSKYNHEECTCNIITGDSSIYRILSKENPRLPYDVASVINHTHPNPLLIQMVSSQLDADRMDYLLRDAYFTGTSYGEFDLERVLRTIRVKNQKLVVKESGIHTIEDYIMARYHMYWQVYYHPVSRSYEAILHSFFKRLLDVYHMDPSIVDEAPMFKALCEKEYLTNSELYELDECACQFGFMQLTKCEDDILKDLSNRLLSRHLFEYDDIYTIEQENEYFKWIQSHGFDPEYYMYVDRTEQRPYQPYRDHEDNAIWVLMRDGSIQELSKVSTIVDAILKGENKNEKKVFFPDELNN